MSAPKSPGTWRIWLQKSPVGAGLLCIGLMTACGNDGTDETLVDRTAELRGAWTRDCLEGEKATLSFTDELVTMQRVVHADEACSVPVRTERVTGWVELMPAELGRPVAANFTFKSVAIEPHSPEEAQRLNDAAWCGGTWIQGLATRVEFAKCPAQTTHLLPADLLLFGEKTLKTGKKTADRSGENAALRPLEVDPQLVWNRKLL